MEAVGVDATRLFTLLEAFHASAASVLLGARRGVEGGRKRGGDAATLGRGGAFGAMQQRKAALWCSAHIRRYVDTTHALHCVRTSSFSMGGWPLPVTAPRR